MSGFSVLLRKELAESWRTRRLPVVALLFITVGIISPLTARYLNEILTAAMGDQLTIPLPIPTAAMALDQLLKNLGQLGALAAIALAMGSVSGELDRGTAALVLAQPATRAAFLAAKLTAIAVVIGVCTALAIVVGWAYTAILFEVLPITGWIVLAILAWLTLGRVGRADVSGLGRHGLHDGGRWHRVRGTHRDQPGGCDPGPEQPAANRPVSAGDPDRQRRHRDARYRSARDLDRWHRDPDRRLRRRGARRLPPARAVASRAPGPTDRADQDTVSMTRPGISNGALSGAVGGSEVGLVLSPSAPDLSLEAALEALHLAGRVDDVLLPGEEGVAVAAHVHPQLLAGRADLELGPARAAVDSRLMVLGMNVALHECSFDAVRAVLRPPVVAAVVVPTPRRRLPRPRPG